MSEYSITPLATPISRYSGGSAISVEQDETNNYQVFVTMEELLEKLKNLNYEDNFIKTLKMRPLSRHYFAYEWNTGEQFFMFTVLCAWLFNNIGINFEQPQEYDDPNATIARIMDSMRNLGVQLDFSPNKLKKGSGYYTLIVLTNLIDKVLQKSDFRYELPKAPTEIEDASDIVDDETELLLDRVEEEMAEEESDDLDEDNAVNVDDLFINNTYMDGYRPDDIMESKTTHEDWKLELERVIPSLKISIKTETDDWRTHFENMKYHQQNLSNVLSDVTTNLGKLNNEIDMTMEKISKREHLINTQFEQLLVEHRNLQEELSVVSNKYKEVNGGILERQQILNNLSDALETVKQEIEERGAAMSDGTPLVNIKKVIKEMKKEIAEMDVYIAVSEHVIIESKLRDKSLEHQLMKSETFSFDNIQL